MLVLSRQRDESLMIGDTIEVVCVDIRGDKIRLGIKAPSNVSVHRLEVWKAIRREGRLAGNLPPSTRVETGPVKIGDDWSGVFVRGDHAAIIAGQLRHFIQPDPQAAADTIEGLLSMFAAVGKVKPVQLALAGTI